MKQARVLMLGYCMISAVMAARERPSADECVVVHLHDWQEVPPMTLASAKGTAMAIYREIGVELHWQQSSPPKAANNACPTVDLEFTMYSLDTFHPGAAGYTELRRDGAANIRVFVNRLGMGTVIPGYNMHIEEDGRYLGYVMAHEIGHALEGVARHSMEGVMKAHYTAADRFKMNKRGLHLAKEDAVMIETALRRRHEISKGE